MTKMKLIDKTKLTAAVDQMITDAKKALAVTDTMFGAGQKELAAAQLKAVQEVKVSKDDSEEKATVAKIKSIRLNVLNDMAKSLSPLFVLKEKLDRAITAFKATDGEEKDVAAFKNAFSAAQTECVNRYKTEGNSTAVDYLKAGFLALAGVLVAILTAPVLLHKPYRDGVMNTFFSGVDTDRSKCAQTQMKADVGSLLEEVVSAPTQ